MHGRRRVVCAHALPDYGGAGQPRGVCKRSLHSEEVKGEASTWPVQSFRCGDAYSSTVYGPAHGLFPFVIVQQNVGETERPAQHFVREI